MIRKPLLICLFVILSGCEGGGFCPFNIPSCCYDALFGCGTFDLPVGCTCSQYGFFSRAELKSNELFRYSRTKNPQNNRSYQGTWSGILDRKSSNCTSFLRQINGLVFIKEKNRSVTVSVPGYGTLKGNVTKTGLQATGNYSPRIPVCKAKVDINYTSIKRGMGRAEARVNYTCASKTTCSATYIGTLQKQ